MLRRAGPIILHLRASLAKLAVIELSALVLTVAIIAGRPAFEGVVNFDDLDTSAGDVSLDAISPYQGFNWTNFSAHTTTPGFPGFSNGIISQPNAAFTVGDALGAPSIGSITAATPFDFGTASMGEAGTIIST
jgi:hypothetical protein